MLQIVAIDLFEAWSTMMNALVDIHHGDLEQVLPGSCLLVIAYWYYQRGSRLPPPPP
jgi:hypothetical protein